MGRPVRWAFNRCCNSIILSLEPVSYPKQQVRPFHKRPDSPIFVFVLSPNYVITSATDSVAPSLLGYAVLNASLYELLTFGFWLISGRCYLIRYSRHVRQRKHGSGLRHRVRSQHHVKLNTNLQSISKYTRRRPATFTGITSECFNLL